MTNAISSLQVDFMTRIIGYYIIYVRLHTIQVANVFKMRFVSQYDQAEKWGDSRAVSIAIIDHHEPSR